MTSPSSHLSHLPSKTNTGLLNSLKASRHGSFTLVPPIMDVRRWSDCDTVQTSYHTLGLAGFTPSFHIVIIWGESLEARHEAVKGHIHLTLPLQTRKSGEGSHGVCHGLKSFCCIFQMHHCKSAELHRWTGLIICTWIWCGMSFTLNRSSAIQCFEHGDAYEI